MAFLFLVLLLALLVLLLWPAPVMPAAIGTAVKAVRTWLRSYWDSQGG